MAMVMAVDLFMVCIYFDVLYTNSYVAFVRYACCYLYHVFYFHDNLLVKLYTQSTINHVDPPSPSRPPRWPFLSGQ
jgi:hypothetical protein